MTEKHGTGVKNITNIFHILKTSRLSSYSILNYYGPVVTLCTTSFNVQKFYVRPTQYIFVFCMDLTTYDDYFPIQH